ncbi:hypothetical protein GCU67_01720 [Modestobacter muralis]|uniref:Uncharacterized protein n=1 Tax=Modestobacter muralis TaxID=1608614 RepID=A0A6P0H1T0_9ACTN|nr:hypothetical protein [Modestobacter muralis]NEK92893.1 hypothetical protein [Modestobacter muralis]NEN49660.1 hypothetical protein [Modestobacter muralis]
MRVTFLVYGVLYVVIEVVGYQLEQVSWPAVTALDVATALTDAFLTVAVLVGVLVGIDVLGHRWRRARQLRLVEEARLATAEWADPGTLDVRSWRAEPVPPQLALPASPRRRRRRSSAEEAYADNAYARPVAPPGRLL